MNTNMIKLHADLKAAAEVMTNLAVELKAAREEFEIEMALSKLLERSKENESK